MFAPCDRWDVGGFSDVGTSDENMISIFLHDRQIGEVGFAERGYRRAEDWLRSALIRIESCSCDFGCPACVVSADCGRVNQSLDKATAALLLRLLVMPSSTPNARH